MLRIFIALALLSGAVHAAVTMEGVMPSMGSFRMCTRRNDSLFVTDAAGEAQTELSRATGLRLAAFRNYALTDNRGRVSTGSCRSNVTVGGLWQICETSSKTLAFIDGEETAMWISTSGALWIGGGDFAGYAEGGVEAALSAVVGSCVSTDFPSTITVGRWRMCATTTGALAFAYRASVYDVSFTTRFALTANGNAYLPAKGAYLASRNASETVPSTLGPNQCPTDDIFPPQLYSEAYAFTRNVTYGTFPPPSAMQLNDNWSSNYQVNLMVLSTTNASSVFEVDWSGSRWPAAVATTAGSGRALAFAHRDFASGLGADLPFFVDSTQWLSHSRDTVRVVVGSTSLLSFWNGTMVDAFASLGRTLVVIYAGQSNLDTWLPQADLLVLTGTHSHVSAANAVIVRAWLLSGGSLFLAASGKWVGGSCVTWGPNRIMQDSGVYFCCRYWNTGSYGLPTSESPIKTSIALQIAYLNHKVVNGHGVQGWDTAYVDTALFTSSISLMKSRNKDDTPVEIQQDMLTVLNSGVCSSVTYNFPVVPGGAVKLCMLLYPIASSESVAPAAPAARHFPGLDSHGLADALYDATPVFNVNVAISTRAARFQFTGWWAKPGDTITVRIANEFLAMGMSIVIGINRDQFVTSDKDSWSRTPSSLYASAALTANVTQLAFSHGGPVLLDFPDSVLDTLPLVTLTLGLDNVVPMARFQQGVTDEAAYNASCANAAAPFASYESSLLHFFVPRPTLCSRSFAELEASAAFWDEIVPTYEVLRGLAWPRRINIIVHDYQISVGYLHSGYPIMSQELGVNSNLPTYIVVFDAAVLYDSGSWGVCHELGHNAEGALSIMFSGTVEVVTNVFVCHGYSVTGSVNSRCFPSSYTAPLTTTNSIFADFGFFERLAFFNQIVEAFTWESLQRAFARSHLMPSSTTDEEKRSRLLVLWSLETGRDLTPMFDLWKIDGGSVTMRYRQGILAGAPLFWGTFESSGIVDSSDNGHSLEEYDARVYGTSGIVAGREGPLSQFPALAGVENTGAVRLRGSQASSVLRFRTNCEKMPSAAGNMTIEAWVKPDSHIQPFAGIVVRSSGDGTGTQDFALTFDDTARLRLTLSDTSLAAVSRGRVSVNVWTHVAVTWDTQTARFYLNGVFDSAVDLAGASVSNTESLPLFLGFNDNAGSTLQTAVVGSQMPAGVPEPRHYWSFDRMRDSAASDYPLNGIPDLGSARSQPASAWSVGPPAGNGGGTFLRPANECVRGKGACISIGVGRSPVYGMSWPESECLVRPHMCAESGLTVSLWLKKTSTGRYILNGGEPYSSSRGGVQIYKTGFYLKTTTRSYGISYTLSNDGDWHHYVLTYSHASGLRAYDNGVRVGEDVTGSAGSYSYAANRVAMMPWNTFPWNSYTWQYTTALLDELAVWHTNMSDAQVATLYSTAGADLSRLVAQLEPALFRGELASVMLYNSALSSSTLAGRVVVPPSNLKPFLSKHVLPTANPTAYLGCAGSSCAANETYDYSQCNVTAKDVVACNRVGGLLSNASLPHSYSACTVAIHERCSGAVALRQDTDIGTVCSDLSLFPNDEGRCVANAVECTPPAGIANGGVECEGTDVGERCVYTCNAGYAMDGVPMRVCSGDGTWRAVTTGEVLAPSTCSSIPCTLPASLPDGLEQTCVVNALRNELYECAYSCPSATDLQGSAERVCNATSGEWEPTLLPNCTVSQCLNAPAAPELSVVSCTGQDVGDHCLVSCNNSLILVGDDSLVCTNEGVWRQTRVTTCQVNAPRDCVLSSWTTWSDCSAVLSTGGASGMTSGCASSRSRYVVVTAENGGVCVGEMNLAEEVECTCPSDSAGQADAQSSSMAAIGAGVGAAIGLLILAIVGYVAWRHHRKGAFERRRRYSARHAAACASASNASVLSSIEFGELVSSSKKDLHDSEQYVPLSNNVITSPYSTRGAHA